MGSGLPRAREEVVWQVVTGWTSWWCLVFQYEDTPSQTEVFLRVFFESSLSPF